LRYVGSPVNMKLWKYLIYSVGSEVTGSRTQGHLGEEGGLAARRGIAWTRTQHLILLRHTQLCLPRYKPVCQQLKMFNTLSNPSIKREMLSIDAQKRALITNTIIRFKELQLDNVSPSPHFNPFRK